ncbi:hypothetical protein QBC34DRAFT_95323 [Podospora aff. communis PSN243]|uniref:Uncharacterized protein n=1 Tax=Podospora aff. communis PSN243 TaxID=3040156 RepID=A0AAV9GNF5_9PEZI|nr:hypothetical protein QBC34DRAFT_95323 [Podospora aff. communis PSN243]
MIPAPRRSILGKPSSSVQYLSVQAPGPLHDTPGRDGVMLSGSQHIFFSHPHNSGPTPLLATQLAVPDVFSRPSTSRRTATASRTSPTLNPNPSNGGEDGSELRYRQLACGLVGWRIRQLPPSQDQAQAGFRHHILRDSPWSEGQLDPDLWIFDEHGNSVIGWLSRSVTKQKEETAPRRIPRFPSPFAEQRLTTMRGQSRLPIGFLCASSVLQFIRPVSVNARIAGR